MILVLDNYDSFTFNLVQYLGELGADLTVRRNDALSLEDLRAMKPRGLVISPGPGRPEDAGATVDLIRELTPQLPILGVCLGHQAIAYAFGGKIVVAEKLMHGKTSMIRHSGNGVFASLPNPFEATRYHSLIVERESLPSVFESTAETEEGVVMGLRHLRYPVFGVQFHPESILTGEGKKLLSNFLDICQEHKGTEL